MPRVQLAAVPLLAGLLPLTAGALGLGEITLRSALNQPFVAEIPVTAASAEELDQLNVQLAPAATFQRFGLDRQRFLDDLKFQIQRDGARAVVRVSSTQPVSEPFVSLLLDVNWPQGRLLREYTVLLDPPSFAASPAPAAVAAPPAATGASTVSPSIQRAPADPAPTPAPAASPPASSVGTGASGTGSPGTVTRGPDGDTYGPVRSNETLWAISDRLRSGSNASLNQMMVALYRANPEAFAGNINRLRRGAILRIPSASDVAAISNREALSEVQRQDENWRQGVVDAATAAPPAAPAREQARLELVPPAEESKAAAGSAAAGAASAPGVAGADRSALERELAEKERLLSLRDSQLRQLQERVRELEGSPAATPLPSEAPVAGTPPIDDIQVEEAPAESPEATVPAAEVEAAAKPARPAAPAPARAADKGLLGRLAGLVLNAWFLIPAALVLLVGLFLVFARRRMASGDTSDRFADDFRDTTPVSAGSTQPLARRDGYSVEEGPADHLHAAPSPVRKRSDSETPLERTISTEGAVELDQADVIAEADFHMAYGLYDQAAELLTRALRDSPDRRDLRLKLLEVYFIWENKTAFLKEAQVFRDQLRSTDDPDWNKVVIMGKQICPDEPIFAGAVAAIDEVGVDLGSAASDASVDITFGDDAASDVDLDLTAARQGPSADLLDFDLGDVGDDSSLDETSMMKTQIAPREFGRGEGDAPTIEARYGGDSSRTMETPTIESRSLGSTMETPTIENPAIQSAGGGTVETPTLESAVAGLQSAGDDALKSVSAGDHTEEINLEDLGLDLSGLYEVAGELVTGIHEVPDSSASGEFTFDIGEL